MQRNELARLIAETTKDIVALFNDKNRSYGADGDAFYNFRETARRIYGSESYCRMFKVLLTLMDKHLVAVANNGLGDPEFEQRMKDICVYALIALAMKQEADKNGA